MVQVGTNPKLTKALNQSTEYGGGWAVGAEVRVHHAARRKLSGCRTGAGAGAVGVYEYAGVSGRVLSCGRKWRSASRAGLYGHTPRNGATLARCPRRQTPTTPQRHLPCPRPTDQPHITTYLSPPGVDYDPLLALTLTTTNHH